jgi:hypothetical protein
MKMNFDNLYKWAAGIVIAASLAGHLSDLQVWIWTAQAKLIHDSRTSTWGSPRFFDASVAGSRRPAAAIDPLSKQEVKTTTDRKIHSESRSN